MRDCQTTTLTLVANGATPPVPMLEFVVSGMLPPDILVGFSGGATLSWAVEITQDDVTAAAYNPADGKWSPLLGMGGLLQSRPRASFKTAALTFAVSAVRLVVKNHSSGTATLQVVQPNIVLPLHVSQ